MILAVDTSASGGSLGLARSGRVVAQHGLEGRRQAADLVPAIETVLASADVTAAHLTAVVVGEGPGSFTGVRVAAATAKGMARALGIDLFGVSSLAAAAVNGDVARQGGTAGGGAPPGALDAPKGPALRYVLFDARGDRIYGACYRVDDTHITEVMAPHGGTIADVLDPRDGGDPIPGGTVFLGDGATRHRQVLEAAGHTVLGPPHGRPTARGLLRVLELTPHATPVGDLDTWEPRYVRPSNAERGRGL